MSDEIPFAPISQKLPFQSLLAAEVVDEVSVPIEEKQPFIGNDGSNITKREWLIEFTAYDDALLSDTYYFHRLLAQHQQTPAT